MLILTDNTQCKLYTQYKYCKLTIIIRTVQLLNIQENETNMKDQLDHKRSIQLIVKSEY